MRDVDLGTVNLQPKPKTQDELIKDAVAQARMHLEAVSIAIEILERAGCDVALRGWYLPEDKDTANHIPARYFEIGVTKTSKF